jgi:hypothetical protein
MMLLKAMVVSESDGTGGKRFQEPFLQNQEGSPTVRPSVRAACGTPPIQTVLPASC